MEEFVVHLINDEFYSKQENELSDLLKGNNGRSATEKQPLQVMNSKFTVMHADFFQGISKLGFQRLDFARRCCFWGQSSKLVVSCSKISESTHNDGTHYLRG